MCLSEYDLVCDKCRKKYDDIFGSYRPATVEEEQILFQEWVMFLCENCRKLLREEGYINGET